MYPLPNVMDVDNSLISASSHFCYYLGNVQYFLAGFAIRLTIRSTDHTDHAMESNPRSLVIKYGVRSTNRGPSEHYINHPSLPHHLIARTWLSWP